MAGAGIDLGGTAHLDDGLGRVAERTCGVHHIVKQDTLLAVHIADHIHDLAGVGLLTALVDDGQVHAHLLGKGAGAGHRAHIGGDDHHVFALFCRGHCDSFALQNREIQRPKNACTIITDFQFLQSENLLAVITQRLYFEWVCLFQIVQQFCFFFHCIFPSLLNTFRPLHHLSRLMTDIASIRGI